MDETSTTETTAEQSIRQARLWFKAENLPFPEELLTPAYKPYMWRVLGDKSIPLKDCLKYIDEHRHEFETERAYLPPKSPSDRLYMPKTNEPLPSKPNGKTDSNPTKVSEPDAVPVPNEPLKPDGPKRTPRPTLTQIKQYISERNVRLSLTDANRNYIYSRFDGMSKLYNLLAEMPRTYGISNVRLETWLRLKTKQLKKQYAEIADMTDNLVRSVVHAVAFGRERSYRFYRLSYGANVKMLREHGRNYALQFPDGLGVVPLDLTPTRSAEFDSWLVSTAFVIKTVDIKLTKEWRPYATFSFLELDVVGTANKQLNKIGGKKLSTEMLRDAVNAAYLVKLHDREITQFMEDAIGWSEPKQWWVTDERNGRRKVRGYERSI